MSPYYGPRQAELDERARQARAHELVLQCMREHRAWWWVAIYRGNCSAFNGYRFTPSDYSEIRCARCQRRWRTKAAYADTLPDRPPATGQEGGRS